MPSSDVSQLEWTNACLEDLKVLHQLDWRWAGQNFRVCWEPGDIKVNRSNLNDYRVLRRDGDVVGYVEWSESSEGYPEGLIWDPIVPDMDPAEIIQSLREAISAPLAWKTCVGSRYENPLRNLGCLLEETQAGEMIYFLDSKLI